jgi:hypothetical protein
MHVGFVLRMRRVRLHFVGVAVLALEQRCIVRPRVLRRSDVMVDDVVDGGELGTRCLLPILEADRKFCRVSILVVRE